MANEKNLKQKKKKKKKTKMGAPTKYNIEYNEQVEKLCMLGAIDIELADFFNVCEKTIDNWKKDNDFLQSIKRGKEIADMKVVESLFKRANGYEHNDIHFSSYEGNVTQTPYIKRYAPDPTSMIFWIKNRRPRQWRDKQEMSLMNPDGSELLSKGIKIKFESPESDS